MPIGTLNLSFALNFNLLIYFLRDLMAVGKAAMWTEPLRRYVCPRGGQALLEVGVGA